MPTEHMTPVADVELIATATRLIAQPLVPDEKDMREVHVSELKRALHLGARYRYELIGENRINLPRETLVTEREITSVDTHEFHSDIYAAIVDGEVITALTLKNPSDSQRRRLGLRTLNRLIGESVDTRWDGMVVHRVFVHPEDVHKPTYILSTKTKKSVRHFAKVTIL